MSRPLIMVVDDSENVRELLQHGLEAAGYAVVTCADSETALQQLAENPPDLITLDIMMPGKGGIDLLHEIRKLGKQLPIIMVSAWGDFRQDFSVWASDAYLVKSSNLLNDLLNKIREMLP